MIAGDQRQVKLCAGDAWCRGSRLLAVQFDFDAAVPERKATQYGCQAFDRVVVGIAQVGMTREFLFIQRDLGFSLQIEQRA